MNNTKYLKCYIGLYWGYDTNIPICASLSKEKLEKAMREDREFGELGFKMYEIEEVEFID